MFVVLHLNVLSRCDRLVLWGLTWRDATGNDLNQVVRISGVEAGDRIPIDSGGWREDPMQC